MSEEFIKFLEDQFKAELVPNLQEFIKIPNVSRDYNPDWKTDGLQLKGISFMRDWFEKLKIPGA